MLQWVQERLGVLQWVRVHHDPPNTWTCTLAAEGGHLGLLQWVRMHGCQWDKWTTAAAAQGGHLEVLVWAREHGCPWGRAHDGEEGEDSCALAAEGGHLEVCSGRGSTAPPGTSRHVHRRSGRAAGGA